MGRPVRVLLGVCGGIAAYKAAEVLRGLQQQGAEVRVVMTSAAQRFVGEATFAALSGHRVFTDLATDSAADGVIEHIAQAQWAEVLLVVPATASTLAKLRAGLADDFLSAAYLAAVCPVVVAPAMNGLMWDHAATRENVAALRARGHVVVAPGSGYLACGMTGDGRLAEVAEIVEATLAAARPVQDLLGETVLVTAGGTREPIDAVRFLGNRSSGRMGFALAAAARRRGARVVIVAGSVAVEAPAGCEVVRVGTAAEMQAAVLERLAEASMVVKAAAVGDFRVRNAVDGKMERSGEVTLELEPTEDIVRRVVEERRAGTLVVAFAAETSLDVARAREKLRRKGADAIVLNDISAAGLGFESERNAVVFLTAEEAVEIPAETKGLVAERILDEIVAMKLRSLQAR